MSFFKKHKKGISIGVGIFVVLAFIGFIEDTFFPEMLEEPQEQVTETKKAKTKKVASQSSKKENKKEVKQEAKKKTDTEEDEFKRPKKSNELIPYANNFDSFIETYANLSAETRDSAWRGIFKHPVTWTGKVIYTNNRTRIWIISKDRYFESANQQNVLQDNLGYYVFIAKSDDLKLKRPLRHGETITVSGTVESSGNYDSHSNWGIYNSTVVKYGE